MSGARGEGGGADGVAHGAGDGWRRCGREFFATDPVSLSQRLIGCRLVRWLDGERLAGVIVETEAYLGVRDAASHSFGGRRTARVEPMYGEPGTFYVYFTYGMHFCCNVVCGAKDEPVAVLIRALEPVEGLSAMRARRGVEPARGLCSGPAKLCGAMGIDRELTGADLVGGSSVWVEWPAGGRVVLSGVEVAWPMVARGAGGLGNGARIGIGAKGPWARRRLRWWARASEHVSR